MIGIVVAFAGVAIIASTGVGSHSDGLGVVLGILTAFLYAAGVLTQKVALRTVDPISATWIGSVVGTVVLTPFLPQAIGEFSRASGGAIAAVAYLGIFPPVSSSSHSGGIADTNCAAVHLANLPRCFPHTCGSSYRPASRDGPSRYR